ncbi:fructose 2,6-bisphosphatase [Kitasatospora sp. NE20-6]|uniref:histidine phosphatase family protein n=1 Tax=Kitasatospora sp. NE20-6 TaxID=2859066 RepID=UPI0034DBB529
MPTVHLLRHGQASAHAADYDVLSDLGREQARLLGGELHRRQGRVTAISTGTLVRQRDTAAIAAAAAGLALPAVKDRRWNEYDHLALLDGVAHGPGFQERLDTALTRWAQDPDGSWPEFRDGARAALDDLAGRLASGESGLVFTSGGVVAAICASLLGPGPGGFVALNRITVNASVTTVVVGRRGAHLLSFNDHAYLHGRGRSDLVTFR